MIEQSPRHRSPYEPAGFGCAMTAGDGMLQAKHADLDSLFSCQQLANSLLAQADHLRRVVLGHKAWPCRDHASSAWQHAITLVVGEENDWQITLQVFLLIDAEEHVSIGHRLKLLRTEVERGEFDLAGVTAGLYCFQRWDCDCGHAEERVRVVAQDRGLRRLLRASGIRKTHAQHLRGTTHLGKRVGKALAAKVESGIADLAIQAYRLSSPGICHPKPTLVSGVVLGLPDMEEDAKTLVHVRPRVRRNYWNPRCNRPLNCWTEDRKSTRLNSSHT